MCFCATPWGASSYIMYNMTIHLIHLCVTVRGFGTPWRTPVCLPDSGILPARFPLAFPWLFLNVMPDVYPERAGIPKLEGGWSSGDISSSHSVVSCGHRNVPHASISHYTTSPDSSGLLRPPSRTLLHYNGSFPSRPTPRSERLVCAAPAHPRTICLYGSSAHNKVTEPVYESTHGTLPTQIIPTITYLPEYIYLTTINNASLSHNSKYVRLL